MYIHNPIFNEIFNYFYELKIFCNLYLVPWNKTKTFIAGLLLFIFYLVKFDVLFKIYDI
jgi:formate hydrogenlyase subunit 4